ncbi:putative sugar transport system permease [Yersinia pseudotuberculosis]|uniref:ABC transporter permease n=1 Tax=Yersinia pseudotuberculosis TaxID=633 RepID=UPI0004F77284|nr:ABC transporter permease [Yersinia pseudotuberculosis]AIN14040.1 branched-chain amino acid transport system / permease component family protein [Yersinia pseudotuberculosis]AJJ07156.1 branched-chain amino acid transport system / permease component family protein [Yersinia pseudotuberculosis]CNK17739.1 putative sugar transport system permease [Yersinia pseudotuberculosis]CNK34510.1 putative sugar transport system permease [Yersinia pseudotuberculosis]SUQ16910.1 putative sugar transport syste
MGSIVKEVDDVRQVPLMKRTALFLLDNSTTVVFIVMLIAAGFFSDRFYSGDNITNVLRQSVPLGLAALGMLFVILTGGIDLSIGSIMAFVSVLVGLLIPEFGLWPALIAGVGIATLMGAFSGFLVTWFNIAPFIATLAMMTIARGVALIISKGQPVFIDNDAFVNFGTGYFLGIPLPVYVFLGFAIICQLVYKNSVFGRLVVSIGSNETATRFAGIRVNNYKLAVYAISAFACGAAGIISATRTGVGSPVLSIGFELDVIAAVVVGGASLAGGHGNVVNTIIGVFILSIISNLMNLMNISGYNQQVVKGVIIIIAVMVQSLKSRSKA